MIEPFLSTGEMDAKLDALPRGLHYFPIETGNQGLCYIGARHRNEVEDPQNEEIELKFNEFTEKHDSKSIVVLVEGRVDKATFADRSEAIKKGGEGGLATFLAKSNGIQVMSPEPSELFEIEKLLEKFSVEDIIEYYFARQAHYWGRLPVDSKQPFKEHIERRLGLYREYPAFKNFDFSLDNLIKIHQKRYPAVFSENNTEDFYEESRPKTGNVSEASGLIRDEFIVNKIVQLWKQGKNIFIVYGIGHAVVQEDALKKLLK